MKLNVDDTPPIPPAPQKLDIIVFDSGNLHNTQASVTVTVVEANDNSPVIQIRPSSGPGEIYDGTPSLQMLVEIQVLVVDDGNEGYSFNLDSKSSADGVFGMNVVGPSTVSRSRRALPIPDFILFNFHCFLLVLILLQLPFFSSCLLSGAAFCYSQFLLLRFCSTPNLI